MAVCLLALDRSALGSVEKIVVTAAAATSSMAAHIISVVFQFNGYCSIH
jgi:hypothetical protein